MQVGVLFPQTELGGDIGAVRAYAEAAVGLGYRHLLAYDHVLGADPSVHPNWSGPYDIANPFFEPMVLFGYLSAITDLELVSGIVIAPQRQTVLLAKQAAQVDVCCRGRLRLGLGIGWNEVEYKALGMDFASRGRRFEEQVGLLRALWTTESVTMRTGNEDVVGAGIQPMPVQRPIPIWVGAGAPAALRRAGRIGDGWFPLVPPDERFFEAQVLVAEGAASVGRDGALPFEGRVNWTAGGPEQLERHVEKWRSVGASYVAVNTMGAGLGHVDAHIDAITRAAEVCLD
jgi:probable F420-dependent oxidoreductase